MLISIWMVKATKNDHGSCLPRPAEEDTYPGNRGRAGLERCTLQQWATEKEVRGRGCCLRSDPKPGTGYSELKVIWGCRVGSGQHAECPVECT